jgi:hypothetical protein
MEHDVRAPLQWPAQVRRGEGVVDHQRDVGGVRDRGHGGDVQHVDARVADRFAIDHLGLWADRAPEVLGIVRVDKCRIDPKAPQADIELRVRAAVERAGGHNLIAGLQQRSQRDQLGGLAAGHRQRADATFERGDPLLEHGGGRVHDSGVDIAEALQIE